MFFPISQLHDCLEPIAFITPLWHGVQLTRAAALGVDPRFAPWVSVAYLVALTVVGAVIAARSLEQKLIS